MKLSELKNKEYDKLVKLLKKNCKHNLNAIATGASTPLYRGIQWDTTKFQTDLKRDDVNEKYDCCYGVVPGRTSPRRSLTTSNVIIDYVSSAEKWKEFPKRNLSASCTPSKSHAYQFGKIHSPYLVIPFDNVKAYGICNEDFNYNSGGHQNSSLLYVFDELNVFCLNYNEIVFKYKEEQNTLSEQAKELIQNLIKFEHIFDSDTFVHFVFNVNNIKIFNKALDEIFDVLHEFESIYPNRERDRIFRLYDSAKYLKEHILQNMSLLEWCEHFITPEKLKCTVVNTLSDTQFSRKSEIWFEGSYMILQLRLHTDPAPFEWLTELNKAVQL